MKSHRRLMIFATILVALIGLFAAVACKRSEEPELKTEGPETGVYYYDAESGQYLLNLFGGDQFTLALTGKSLYGTYSISDGSMTMTPSNGEEDFSAAVSDGEVSLVYDGASMRFLRMTYYNLSFDSKGGPAIQSLQVLNGRTAERPQDPVREGFVFLGWFTDESFTEPFLFGTRPVTANTTVYANWAARTVGDVEYRIEFDLGYEAEEYAPAETLGGKLVSLPTPERSNYTFVGWWASMYGSREKLSYPVTQETVFTESQTLYAVWAQGDVAMAYVDGNSVRWNGSGASYTYEIKGPSGFVTLDGTTGSASVSVDFASAPAGDYEITLTSGSTSTTTYYRNRSLSRVSKFSVVSPSTLLFNPVENAKKYYITVECGNPDHRHNMLDIGNSTNYNFLNCEMGENGIRFTVTAVAEGYASSVSETFVYRRALGAIGSLRIDQTNDVVYWDEVENAAEYVVSVRSGQTTVQARTSSTSYSLKNLPAGDLKVEVYPATEGYCSPDAATAEYRKNTLACPGNLVIVDKTLTFDAVNGASSYEVRIGSQTFQVSGTTFNLETFSGWILSGSYTLSVRAVGGEGSQWTDPLDIRYLAMGESLVYANNAIRWTPVVGAKAYQVRVNGGALNELSEGETSMEITFLREGDNSIEVRFFDGNVWSEFVSLTVRSYAVTFDTRGGSPAETVYVAEGDEFTLPEATKTGYEINGWYTSPGGAKENGKKYTDRVFRGNASVVLFANWQPRTYTITYQDQIGGVVGTQEVVFGEEFELKVPSTASAQGGNLAFSGWYSAAGGAGNQLTDVRGRGLSVWSIPDDVSVYAYWAATLSYTLVDGGYSVSQGPAINLVSEIVIPAYVNTDDGTRVRVVEIGAYAFWRCFGLKSIGIPESIDVIDTGSAFRGCNALEEIEVYSVPEYTTGEIKYSSADGVLIYNNTLIGRDVYELAYFPAAKTGAFTVPEQITSLPYRSFYESTVTRVTIPASVTNVEGSAFYNLRHLTEVVFLPGGTAPLTVASGAFQECPYLAQVTFPARLAETDFGGTQDGSDGPVFYSCSSLSSILFEQAQNATYSSVNGVVANQAGDTLVFCPVGLKGAVTIPDTVTAIGEGAFEGVAGITEVTISKNIRTIGRHAFYGCRGLRKVTFVAGGLMAATIGEEAFANSSLTEIEMAGANIEEIGVNAFAGTQVSSVLISGLVTSIESGAFSSNRRLEKVEFEANQAALTFGAGVFADCIYLQEVKFAEQGGQDILFGEGMFRNCTALTSMFLPESVVSLSQSVFEGCDNIRNIEVATGNRSLSSVGGVLFNYAKTELLFYPRGKEATYEIPDSVEKIADGVFSGNTVLQSITIPAKITSIGRNAFKDCTALSSVEFEGTGEGLTLGEGVFEGCVSLTEIDLPTGLTEIPARAFYMESGSNSKLHTVTFGNVNSIGAYAFYGLTLMTEVTIPDSLVSVGEYAFAYTALETIDLKQTAEVGDGVFYGCDSLTSVTANALTRISASMFRDCVSLTAYTVPASVTKIGSAAFIGTGLTTLTFAESGMRAGNELEIESGEEGAFQGVSIVSVDFPDRLVSIGDNAFYNCFNLETVEFGSNPILQNIGEYAFSNARIQSIEIPATICMSVYGVGIGDSAFEMCENLQTVTFKEGSEEFQIGGSAFYGCSELTEVTIPANCASLGEDVFGNCSQLQLNVSKDSTAFAVKDGVIYSADYRDFILCPVGNKGTDSVVTVPKEINSLPKAAFYGCSEIREIIFEEGGTSNLRLEDATMGDGVFSLCTSLSKVTLSSNFTYIGTQAFVNTAVTELKIPANVTRIGDSAFQMSSLQTVEFEPESKLTEIVQRAFMGCSSLQEITLPKSLTMIGNYAFSGCSGLTSIEFEEGCALTSIGNQAFMNSAIEKIVLPDGVKYLIYAPAANPWWGDPDTPFAHCENLRSITLPKNLESFDSNLFASCTSLSEIIVPEGCANYCSQDDVIYSSNMDAIYYYPSFKEDEGFAVPAGVKTIGDNLFNGNTYLTSVTLPDGLLTIGSYAFANSRIANIEIPASVQTLGDHCFYGLSDFTELKIRGGNDGSSLTTIGESAFESTGLVSLTLPHSVTTIGAIFGMTGLYSLEYLDLSQTQIRTIPESGVCCRNVTQVLLPSTLETIEMNAFSGCSSLQSIEIPRNVTSIGQRAFQDCSQLTEIVLPDGLVELGPKDPTFPMRASSVFSGTGITSIEIPAGITEIGASMFSNTPLESITFRGNQVTTIGSNAFEGTKITSIEIPAGVTEIGSYAFYNCELLASVIFNGQNLLTMGDNVFEGCVSLQEVLLPEGVRTLGGMMFVGSGVQTVSLPDSVETWGAQMFDGVESLTSVSIPENAALDTIPEAMFRGTSIETIEFPGTIREIGEQAFYGVESLLAVEFSLRIVSVGSYAFYGCSGLGEIKLAEGLLEIGDYAFAGCTGVQSVTIPGSVASLGVNPFQGIGDFDLGESDNFVYEDGVLYNYAKTKIYSVSPKKEGDFIVPDGVELSIGCFAGIAISSITFPASITEIPDHLLENCKNLSSVTFEGDVTRIGEYAFAGTALSTFEIPKCMTSVGDHAFENSGLVTLTFEAGAEGEELSSLSIGGYAFASCAALESVAFPARLSGLGEYALFGCESLKDASLEGVEATADEGGAEYEIWDINFGGYVFANSALGKVIYPSGNEIPAGHFMGLGISGDMTISASYTVIGDEAFKGLKNVTKITFKGAVESLGTATFMDCELVQEIAFERNIIGSGRMRMFNLPDSLCENCVNLRTIGITASTPTNMIGEKAFKNCEKLESFDIYDRCRSIGAEAFYNCTSLTQLYIPYLISPVGNDAFYGWTLAQRLIINDMSSIDYWASGWNNNCAAQITQGDRP